MPHYNVDTTGLFLSQYVSLAYLIKTKLKYVQEDSDV